MDIEPKLLQDAADAMDLAFKELIQPDVDQAILPGLLDKLAMASARLNAKLQTETIIRGVTA